MGDLSFLIGVISSFYFAFTSYPEAAIQANADTVLFVSNSKYLMELINIAQRMEEKGYFRHVKFKHKATTAKFYPEALEDEKLLLKNRAQLGSTLARTFPDGTRRILFFDPFFEKDENTQRLFFLHEIAHLAIYDSGINRNLYNRIGERNISNVRVDLDDTRDKFLFERVANKDVGYILSLPDEILAEKWMYEYYPDQFQERINEYLEGDTKNVSELEGNIIDGKAGNLDLQKIINRVLFINSIYSFYDWEFKEVHLLLMKKNRGHITKIAQKTGFSPDFIFVYMERIVNECIKDRIDVDSLIQLFLSYRTKFLKTVFNYGGN